MPNIFTTRRDLVVNAEALRRTLGDDEARKIVSKALAKFDAAQPHLENLHDIRECWAALDFFKKEYGVDLPERDLKSAFGRWDEAGRNKTHDLIRLRVLEVLSAEVTPTLARCAKAIARRLRQDAEALRTVCAKIAQNYGCSHAQTNLEADLFAVAERFEADAKGQVDLTSHYSPRIFLSVNFEKPL